MSEYQYYEFQAIDRPLTESEMKQLRSYSTRARITPASFVVDYAYGNFKGNDDVWMEQYFDAFLYLANWGTHVLKLRLPSQLLALETARTYCTGEGAEVRETGDKVILSFHSDDEEGGEWIEGEGELASLLPVRAELARGDLRALYLGWLMCAGSGELEDDAVEPLVPPGLGQLSASLHGLAEFLRLDRDLLAVAAQGSQPLEEWTPRRADVRTWVARLSEAEKDSILCKLIVDADPSQLAEFRQRFLRERQDSAGVSEAPAARRTVGDLLAAADAHAEERRRREADERAKEKARRERESAAARTKHLDRLVGQEPALWVQVEELAATKQPRSYERAVEILLDLRDLAGRKKESDFLLRLAALRQTHERKRSFLERLRKAGL
jgi:hypothetical protein